MANTPAYLRAYQYLRQNWSSIAAVVSTIGFVVCYIIPPLRIYYGPFIFVGANAVIWTLIELKMHLLTNRKSLRYANMRLARPDITAAIIAAMKKKKLTKITIVGGRLRTISDILREVSYAIHVGELKARNAHIEVFCLDPDYILSRLSGEALNNSEAFADRFSGYRQLINQSCSDLLDFWKREEFQKANIRLEISLYQEFPFAYFYLIDDAGVFWGHFTWDQHTEDFNGPANPCHFIGPSSDIYEDFHSWLKNRVDFYRITAKPMSPPRRVALGTGEN